MQAKDVMTAPAVTIDPDTQVYDIAQLLLERHISAVPVVVDGQIVGMVSESDLLHRHEIGTDRSAAELPWWKRLLGVNGAPAEYVKSHGRRARDIMTAKIVAVSEETSLAQLAALFDAHRIKRIPVLRGTQLVGIVSRANLVRALALQARSAAASHASTDESIRSALLAELVQQPWWRPVSSTVSVTDGVVRYLGLVESDSERQAARVAAENVPGVRRVEDHRLQALDMLFMT